jgi:hypothetical protein
MTQTINDRKKDDQMWADKDRQIKELQEKVRELELATENREYERMEGFD